MADGSKTLGQRIVEAARLATIAHLSQRLQADPVARRREAVGGADPGGFTDEARLPPADDECFRHVRRRASSSFAAEGRAA